MKFTTLLNIALLGATSTLAAPTESEAEVVPVAKRQSATRYCGTTPYTTGAQDNAFNYAQSLEETGGTVTGTSGSAFPHDFNNNPENFDFPDCSGVPAPYREFPILSQGYLFTSSDRPGTDRIVYKITGTEPASGLPDTFAFCGVMTHQGAAQGQFVLCGAS